MSLRGLACRSHTFMFAPNRGRFDEALLVHDAGCDRLLVAVNQSDEAEREKGAEKRPRQYSFSLLYSFISKGTVRQYDREEEFLLILCGQE